MSRQRRNFRNNRIIFSKKQVIIIILTLITIAVISFTIGRQGKEISKQQKQEETIGFKQEESQKNTEIGGQNQSTSKVSMLVMGNIICDEEIYMSVYENGTYNFDSIFKNIKEYTQNADIAITTLETSFNDSGYEGKARYNSPKELINSLYNIGISVVNSATNHSFDYKTEGVKSTIAELNKGKIAVTGIKNESSNGIVIKEVNGIKIGFLSYTYGLDNIKEETEELKQYVSLIDKEKMKQDINEAKEKGAEYVCVNLHWRTFSDFTPTKEQQDIAEYLAENGADIIIGTHPEEVEAMEVKQNNEGKNVLIAYSTGNCVSAKSDIGMMLQIQITKNVQNGKPEISLEQVKYIPTYMNKNNGQYEILDIRQAINSYENGEEEIDEETYDYLKLILEKVETRIGK